MTANSHIYGILEKDFGRFRRNIAGALSGDEDAVHDLRVAARRLRTALSVFRKHLPHRDRTDKFRASLKRLASAAGDVRDLDINLDILAEFSAGSPALSPPERLVGRISVSRGAKIAEMRTLFGDRTTAAFIARMKTYIEVGLDNPGSGKDGIQAYCREFRKKTGAAAARLRLGFENIGEGSSDADLHKFRIECKKTRYLCEFCAPVLGGAHSGLARQLAVFQDILGRRNDMYSLEKTIAGHLESSGPECGEGERLKGILSAIADENDRLKTEFLREFKLWMDSSD